jgi:CO/xanthine dehydrogenase Mo-binding subunit
VSTASLQKHPRVGQWLSIGAGGGIRATPGKVELGQGITHTLRLVVAEELQLDPALVEMVAPSTATSPDEAVTSGSLSVQQSGTALRHAAAHLREACREKLARQCGIAAAAVRLEGGAFRAGDASASYADLVDAELLTADVDLRHLAPRGGKASALANVQREDIAQKVFGAAVFLQDLELPGLLHAQVFRPATLQAQVDEAAWSELQPHLAALPGVLQVVRDGLLVGVLAQAPHVLVQAARQLESKPLWHGSAAVPAPQDTAAWLKAQPLDTTVIVDQPGAGVPAARIFRAEYGRGWLQHASIGLSCALAQWTGAAQLRVWSHSQGIFNLRRDLALAFGLPADAVTVQHVPGAGCYGHNGADDVAFDAAWIARHAQGRPVRLQWTRQQELGDAPLGPAMAVAVEAGIDAQGRLVSWQQQVWSQGHGSRPGRGKTPALLGAWQTAQPAPITLAVNQPPATGGGSDRNATPPYTVPRLQVLNHRVLAMPVRVSALRALGAHANVLAAECTIDDIALSLGRDPLEYRLAHLEDERAKAVLQEVARIAGWSSPQAGRPEGWGRGIGFARYKNTSAWCAVVAELVVAERVRLQKLFIAADLGLVIHPDGARNQIEGGAIQAASWTLCEAADLGSEGVRSNAWERYPIFRFGDVPAIETVLIDRPDSPSLGAGECSAGPTAAAIGTAIRDALGLRVGMMPFTRKALERAARG